jgi:hypothetical protein
MELPIVLTFDAGLAHATPESIGDERNDFVMIVALDPPDFRTISDFRKRPFEGARRVVPTGTEVVRDSRL